MNLTQTVAPASEPVEIAELKDHLRIEGDDASHDDVLDALEQAAREWAEDFQNRALISQTWVLRLDEFPDDNAPIELPKPPLQSVTTLQYVDTSGVTQTWGSSNYTVDTTATVGRIFPAFNVNYPATRDVRNAVVITYVAGYGDDAADVPQLTREAIKVLAGKMFENRDVLDEVPLGVKAMLWPQRIVNA